MIQRWLGNAILWLLFTVGFIAGLVVLALVLAWLGTPTARTGATVSTLVLV
jgi:hypothetical protein